MNRKLLKRADLRQLCSFILFGEESDINAESYEKKLDAAVNNAYKILQKISRNDLKEADEFNARHELHDVLDTYSETYTEIGMKLGAQLVFQLMNKDGFIDMDARNTFKVN